MGADNWATCPRCFKAAMEELKRLADAIMADYGKVPVEEFDARRRALPRPEAAGFMTFREDYWFLNDNQGSVEVHYSGVCHVCGLEKKLDTTLDLMEAA